MRLLRSHGERPRYHHRVPGTTARLDALQAAVLRVKLRRLDGWNDGRRNAGAALSAALAGAPVGLPAPAGRGLDHVFHQFVVTTRRARGAARAPRGAWRGDRRSTTPCRSTAPAAYAAAGPARARCPSRSGSPAEVCSLPMHPGLTAAEIERIAAAVREHGGRPVAVG